MNADEQSLAERLAAKIRSAVASGDARAPDAIEGLLERELGHLAKAEKLRTLREVAGQFGKSEERENPHGGLAPTDLGRVVSLFLGRDIAHSGLSPEETSAKLAKSLNTVFDTLNQIVGTIHSTLLGRKNDEETIRQIIGSEIAGDGGDRSLQAYLDQIQQAFLIAHKAFRLAGETVVAQLLSELDPQKMMGSAEGRLKFGRLRKAEFFDTYRDKHRQCNEWLQSGRITDELLREFEKVCQKLYKR